MPEMLRTAVASGRGIGKSALVSWLVLWFLSTRLGSTTIVTANTEQQLRSRTWPEIGKWLTLSINGHWFDKTATALKPAAWFQEAVQRDLMSIVVIITPKRSFGRKKTPMHSPVFTPRPA